MRLQYLIFWVILFAARFVAAQDSLSDDDVFSTSSFDTAIAAGAQSEQTNKLEYLPGVFFLTDVSGTYIPQSSMYGTDARFSGKAFVKASKADVGALYLACNINYFLFASADNEYFQRLYQQQSPDYRKLSVSLSEFHLSFDIQKLVFIRLGSQLISWGASYFWNPEDFINQQKNQVGILSPLDVRSGKPGLRIHIPVHTMNVFLFTDFSQLVSQGIPQNFVQTVGQAWRVDATVNGVNVGTVGYVQHDKPVRLGFDATGNVLSADVYGELALSIRNDPDSVSTCSFSLGSAKTFGVAKDWTARGEFYYNHSGLADTAFSLVSFGSFVPYYSGRYYAYAEISTVRLFTSALGASVFGYANLGDGSYSATLQLAFDLPRVLPFTVYGRYFGGKEDREFTSVYGDRAFQAGIRIRADF
jgi:hypothetical protein